MYLYKFTNLPTYFLIYRQRLGAPGSSSPEVQGVHCGMPLYVFVSVTFCVMRMLALGYVCIQSAVNRFKRLTGIADDKKVDEHLKSGQENPHFRQFQ